MPEKDVIGLDLPEKKTYVGNASVWKRLAAFVLDLLVLDFVVLGFYDSLLKKMLGFSSLSSSYSIIRSTGSLSADLVLLFFIIILFILAYFVLQEYLVGQTLGKMVLGLKVVSVSDDSLGSISFFQALVRSMFIIPTIPFILLWIVDPVYYFFSKDNQRLSEWLARSKVIEVYQL